MNLLSDKQLAEYAHYARLRDAPAPQDAEAIRALLGHIDTLTAERDAADAKADDAIFVAHNVIERCAGLAAEVQFLGVAVTNNDPKEEIALRVKDIHLGLAALAQTKETT